MNVIVLIGFPGAGKSFYAKSLPGNNKIVSSDLYFTDSEGNYSWTLETGHLGHEDCLKKFIKTFFTDEHWYIDNLIVDNTNFKLTDISVYIRIAQAYKFDVYVKYIDTDIDIAKSRNIHGVPDVAYNGMQASFEHLLAYWPKDFPVIEFIKP